LRAAVAVTIALVPIYEFLCESCGSRFEELTDAGVSTARCSHCGSGAARRVYSPPAGPFTLVKTPRGKRQQERKNAQARKDAKARFKPEREQARTKGGGG